MMSIDSTLSEDNSIDAIIAPYKEQLQEQIDVVIGFSPMFLEKKRPSSILGSFMAEAIHETAEASIDKHIDYCLLNYGGIRSTLDSGKITIGEVYELMPFENEIVILVLNKKQMDSLFKQIADKGGEPFVDHLWEGKSAYHVMNQSVYSLATSDYVANGGDNYTILTEAIERIETGIKVRDGIINYITNHNPIPTEYKPKKN